MSKKNIMIFGGEFFNKGAQAMSFITISRLKEEFPNHEILFVSDLDSKREKEELSNYDFKIVPSPFDRNNFPGETLLRKFLKKNSRANPKESKKFLKDTEYLFDISGYALSSQWGVDYSLKYLNRFRKASELGIKSVILPQSIGPFDYTTDKDKVIDEIQNTLGKVAVVMPREIQGKKELETVGISENIYQSPDIVLTNKKSINWSLIYKKNIEETRYTINPNSVMIVPNMKNFEHGKKDDVLKLYKNAITELRLAEKEVYLVRHSFEDIEACELIKELFKEDDKVHILLDDMTPTEFEQLIEQFDYSIASRFHAVVHSFKVGTPCIILGWAVKYHELAKLFNQDKFVFDVRETFEDTDFIQEIHYMNNSYKAESEIIHANLKEMEIMRDPFDFAFSKLNN